MLSSSSSAHRLLLLLFFFFQLLLLFSPCSSQQTNSSSSYSSCPLDFSILNKLIRSAESNPSPPPTDTPTRCFRTLQALHILQSQYLKSNSKFTLPLNTSLSCFQTYQSSTVSKLFPGLNFLSDCGVDPNWISTGCMNISSISDFDSVVPASARAQVARSCNRSLLPVPACTDCIASLNTIKSYLTGPDIGNVSDCTTYPFIYAGGVVNSFGPVDDGTISCLFLFNTTVIESSSSGSGSANKAWIVGVVAGAVVLLALGVVGVWLVKKRVKRNRKKKRKFAGVERNNAALQSIEASTSLIRFKFDEIKAATKNFNRENIIGRGGYGNVYKGVLADGSEIAVKRFKNCTPAGDASFAHEVEVIASVRHVNLVALRGYCTATTKLEGHQRIIVCELMPNGSLHDHLFSLVTATKLSWPIRQKIAIGTARGLAYLHYGAQPVIIHRDIKASNILLDEMFEPKVADFGLAKFAPVGMSHVSTTVAGTLGYVAPEYALYGQLTERSDVYSYGVLLLELLSGKKAFVSKGDGESWVITDWAWSLVQKGRALEVIEEGMEDLGPQEVLEKYVHVAVLASHPQMLARPTMDQIVKILDTDVSLSTIPDRPISIVSTLNEIERSVSSSGSGQLSSFTGYQPFTSGTDLDRSDRSEIA